MIATTKMGDKDKEGSLMNGSAAGTYSTFMKVWTAFFYAVASLMITIVNKSVLTTYGFPSFQVLALGQMSMSVLILFFGKQFSIVSYPDLNSRTFKEISPLPFIYLGNMVFGLGGTKEISLPMFTMLRRFAILITMIAEYYILSIRPNLAVKISVGMMVGGAVIAAGDDLAFNLHGYVLVMISDFLTAANCVYTKKKLNTQKEMGKYGLMFYSALFMLPISILLNWCLGDLEVAYNFPLWTDFAFVFQFFLSSVMGFVLNYSVMLCTQYNSALTTTIMGCLKNILVTYLGMFVGGDYVYSLTNFVGINVSILGSLVYTYVTFKPTKAAPSEPLQVVTHGK